MKTLLILVAAVVLGQTTPVAARMTIEACEKTMDAMLKAAEENRDHALKQLNHDIGRSTNDDEAVHLHQEIERTWDNEEIFRSTASQVYRECVTHVKSGG